MSQYILFLFVGLGVGSIYASLAMGLVVTYKGTGVINFAQGAMAMYGAYVYDELRKTGDLVFPVFWIPDRLHIGSPPFVVCFVLGIISAALLGLVAHFLVFRPLRAAPVLGKVVASVGLMTAIQAMVSLKFDSKARAVTPILPHGQVKFAGLVTSQDRFYLAGIAILIADPRCGPTSASAGSAWPRGRRRRTSSVRRCRASRRTCSPGRRGSSRRR